MKRLLLICFFSITVFLFPSDGSGQASDAQFWSSAMIDWNFEPIWLAELEFNYNQLLSDGEPWREYSIQPSIEYYPSRSFDLLAGVYLTDTKQNSQEDTREIRPFAGFRWNIVKPEKRVFFRAQSKLEYRYFTSREEGASKRAIRIRNRLDIFIPITGQSYVSDNDLYGLAFSEVFVNIDDNIDERYKGTFRQYLGLGYRFSYEWRSELQYVLQLSRDSITDDNFDTTSNVIYIIVKRYFQ